MKVNPQFNKLALGSFQASTIELYDFNNTTGVVSNLVTWNFTFPNSLLYGIEFSPNGNLLYVSNLLRVVQYNITLPTAAQIQNSAFEVSFGISFGYTPASLQLGPDNKIYVASGGIDVINNPNNIGFACGFQTNAVPLQGNSAYGLPQKVYLLGQSAPNTIAVSDSCLQAVIQFTLTDTTGVLSYSWNLGDPASGSLNTSSLVQPSHQFTQAGSFLVTVVLSKGCFSDTVKTIVNIINCQGTPPAFTGLVLSGDTCEATTNFIWDVNGSTGSSFFSWNFGDPASGTSNLVFFSGLAPFPPASHLFSGPGVYNVCLTYQEPGQPVQTTCRLVRIGLCCKPQILVSDTCFETPTNFRLIGVDTLRTANWFFGDQSGTGPVQQLSPTFVYVVAGFYNVEVQYIANCGRGRVNRLIEVINCQKECKLEFPNVVTPNGDGLNDTWQIVQQCSFQNYSLTVFNRWGRPVFKSSDVLEAWKPVSEEGGTYFYQLSLLRVGAESRKEEFKGWIQVVR
jgi:gliding motility-associated-like protein